MTETTERRPPTSPGQPPTGGEGDVVARRWLRLASVLACAVLGFLLVIQFRATENVDNRLEIEREEDLAQILADLSTQSDRLQEEITSLRLKLLAFENTAQTEELALRSLRERLSDLQILSGSVAVEGPGIRLTIDDPRGEVTQELLVDTVQELRDAGAEAIAVNDVRLIASSAFSTRNGKLVLDEQPLQTPIVVLAVGPSQTIEEALSIPGGALDSLESRPQVTARVDTMEQLSVPALPEPAPFVFGEPLPPDTGE